MMGGSPCSTKLQPESNDFILYMKEMGKPCVGRFREGRNWYLGCWTKERGPGQLQVHDEEALKTSGFCGIYEKKKE